MTAHAERLEVVKLIVPADREWDVMVPLKAGCPVDVALTHAATRAEAGETLGQVTF